MFHSFPRTRESRATSAGVRSPWVPAFAGTSGDEQRFNLVRTCFSAAENEKTGGTPVTRLLAVGVCLLSMLSSALAFDEAYPSRPVRLIAAAAPGGNPDVLARLLAYKLSEAFGKPFVVENVPGAGGIVAAKSLLSTAPDGHVLMLGDSGAMAINVALNPDVGYNPLKDFSPITALATVPTVLVINAGIAAQTLDDFVRLAKSQPGKLTYGSAGYGSVHHLTMALFAERAGSISCMCRIVAARRW
jgi:tripartite-type tricarboxylate transporter receptor subunit TctC